MAPSCVRGGSRRGRFVWVSDLTGGVTAEIYDDTAVRLAPIDHATAREMITEVTPEGPHRVPRRPGR